MPIQQNIPAARSMAMDLAGNVMKKGGGGGPQSTEPTMVLSTRQVELDQMWRYFRASTYDGYKRDWDGIEAITAAEADGVATSGSVPQGFYDANQTAEYPLKYRKPTSPYYLGRVIPLRFTSLLFGKKRCPKITADDPLTSDWLDGAAKAGLLWSRSKMARNYGGGMGATALGFKFVRGKVVFEAHDPRWCNPTFRDRSTGELSSLEILYQYPEQGVDAEGNPVLLWFWYRRVIDAQTETVWERVKVVGAEHPNWALEPKETTTHGFGEVPVEWIQNEPVPDDIDGDPDCHGCFEKIHSIDMLWAQAFKGVLADCDPTTVVASDLEFPGGIKKGSDNAIHVEKGGTVSTTGADGNSAKAAGDMANVFEQQVLTMCRCVLENSHANASTDNDKTATEIERTFSSMLDRADDLRVQYGQAIERLLEKLVRAARKVGTPTPERDEGTGLTTIRKRTVTVPKKRVESKGGGVTYEERQLGNGEQVELVWPDYFEPSLQDVQLAVDAIGKAFKVYGIADLEASITFISQYLRYGNIQEMVKRVKDNAGEASMLGLQRASTASDLVAQRTGL